MTEIRFDVTKEFTINDAVTVRFNPTDMNFIQRLYNTFDALESKQDTYKAAFDKAQSISDSEVFTVARDMDNEMRELINALFEFDVCGPVFGNINLYALSHGVPLWTNLILAVMDEIDDSFKREKTEKNPKLQKYLNKYKG